MFIVFNEAIEAILSEYHFRVFTQLFKTPVADDAITVLEEAEEAGQAENVWSEF